MRTDELRSVLHDHGDEAHNIDAPARIAAVHQRVTAVKRRRAAVAGGGLVAAVAAVALAVVPGLTSQDIGPAGAPHELAGFEVPDTEVATGYTYEYVKGVETAATDGPLKLTLPPSDEPRLVMWASSGDEDSTVRLGLPDHDDIVRPAGDFDSYHHVYSQSGGYRISLRQTAPDADDRIAVAVFELSDERPEGVTKHGVTFRAQQLDDRLLGATIGDPGQAEVTTEVTVPEGKLRVSELCFGVEGGVRSDYMVWFSVNGKQIWGSSCAEQAPIDVGTDGATIDDNLRRMGIAPGDTVELRATLVHEDHSDGKPIEGTDAVLGVAGYEVGGTTVEAAGWDLPKRLEFDGHEWVFSFLGESPAGARVHTADFGPTDRPVVLVTAQNALANGARVLTRVDGVDSNFSDFYSGPDAGSWGADSVLEPGRHEVTLEVRRGLTADTRLAIAFYELVH
jgi:hypothetical protein